MTGSWMALAVHRCTPPDGPSGGPARWLIVGGSVSRMGVGLFNAKKKNAQQQQLISSKNERKIFLEISQKRKKQEF